jgi:phage baseplate assembly protein W
MAIGYSAKLPLQYSLTDGPYALNKNIASVVRQNIKMVIFTSPGERCMDIKFGVGIRTYLFEPASELTRTNLRDRIIQQVNTYLPFVQIISLGVTTDDLEPNKLYVNMEYTFPNSELQVLNLEVR